MKMVLSIYNLESSTPQNKDKLWLGEHEECHFFDWHNVCYVL